MQLIIKVLLALAIASPTSVIPTRTYVVEAPIPPPIVESISIPPALLAVAQCESNNRQHDKDGNVVRGEINHFDIGRWQINEFYHGTQATKLGYDIFTEEGNAKMALWLYERQGLKPWNWSKPCWSKKVIVSTKI